MTTYNTKKKHIEKGAQGHLRAITNIQKGRLKGVVAHEGTSEDNGKPHVGPMHYIGVNATGYNSTDKFWYKCSKQTEATTVLEYYNEQLLWSNGYRFALSPLTLRYLVARRLLAPRFVRGSPEEACLGHEEVPSACHPSVGIRSCHHGL